MYTNRNIYIHEEKEYTTQCKNTEYIKKKAKHTEQEDSHKTNDKTSNSNISRAKDKANNNETTYYTVTYVRIAEEV